MKQENRKMSTDDFLKPEYYKNRELSWIQFDDRVLGEARDKTLPLFERLKFLSISASNLDEFFMIRVASLKDMVNAGYTKKDMAGMSASDQLEAISQDVHELVNVQYSTFLRSLVPALRGVGLNFIKEHEDLRPDQAEYADRYFKENVYPVLTPMAVDSSRPFPLVRNKTLNIGALVRKKDQPDSEVEFATVQVPSVLPRIVELPASDDGVRSVILLEEIIERNISRLFLSYDVICAHPYRVMRNADLTIDEDEAADLLKEIQKQLKRRQWGEVIRLEVEDRMEKPLFKILKKEFHVHESEVYKINGPLDLTFAMKLYGLKGYEELKAPAHEPQPVPETMTEESIFDQIRHGDILLHHPYQSFDPVVGFVKQAARDPQVLAIKQTLYRVSGNSPIIAALAQAAENGKQVSVLVELKAVLMRKTYRVGEDAGKSRLPCDLWSGGAENPQQDHPGGAPGGGGHPPVRPSGYRQLQRCHRQAVHGLRTSDVFPGHRRGCHGRIQHAFRLFGAHVLEQADIGAALAAG